MFQTFKSTLLIEFAIKVNSLIYFVKKIPLIGKIIKDSLYGEIEAKNMLAFIVAIGNFIFEFFKKSFYIAIMMFLPAMLARDNITDNLLIKPSILYIFVILSFIYGSVANGKIFAINKMDYHMIMLMRVDPKRYYLINVFIRSISGIILFLPIFLIFKFTFLETIIYLILLAFTRIIGEAINIWCFSKFKNTCTTKTAISVTLMFLAIIVAYVPLLLGRIPNLSVILLDPIVVIVIGIVFIISLLKLWKYDGYMEISRRILSREAFLNSEEMIAQATFMDVKIDEKKMDKELLDSSRFNNKSGYDYLNEIFFYRHRKIVKNAIKNRVYMILITFVIAVVAIIILSDKRSEILGIIESSMPLLVFIMYMISTTEKICRAMFLNCDVSLLKYNYYREAGAILDSFKIRLKKILFFNSIPALVICLCLQILALICGGGDIFKMIPIYVTVLVLSVFFSVYYLCLYYILQPYTSELAVKNPFFNLANGIIYFAAYMCLQVRTSSIIFTGSVLAFTGIFIIGAVFAVYKIAPKSFKLK